MEGLRKASAEKRELIQRKLGEVRPSRPPSGARAHRHAPAAPARERSGLFDAPDESTRKVKDAVAQIRARLAEIARAITVAETVCPKHLEALADPAAADTALRLEDFDPAAAREFLEGATALLNQFKPKPKAD